MSDARTPEQRPNSLIASSAFWQREINRIVSDQIAWLNSPLYQRWQAERKAAWEAKPWYERAWIRTSSKIWIWRERIGEVVAGRRFSDD